MQELYEHGEMRQPLHKSATGSPPFNSDISSELSAILGAAISGAKYGMRIRFPHALVMTFLFRKETPSEKLKIILKATSEHSRNLASFAALYKTILYLLKWMSRQLRNHDMKHRNQLFHQIGIRIGSTIVDGPNYRGRRLISKPPGIPEKTIHAAIAGAIGGYCIWGNYTSVNYQIVLYLTSRILVGLSTLASENNIPPFCWKGMTKKNVYPFKAAFVWSVVMVLFEYCPNVLHSSLKRSMDEIYRCDPFSSIDRQNIGRGRK